MYITQNANGLPPRILEKIAATKWKHLQNTLSDAAKSRITGTGFRTTIKDEAGNLVRTGGMRLNPAEELARINEGTKNILRRNGFTMQEITDPADIKRLTNEYGGYGTFNEYMGALSVPSSIKPHTNVVAYVPASVQRNSIIDTYAQGVKLPKSPAGNQPTINDWIDAICLRHEALETTAFTKAKKKYDKAMEKYRANPGTPKPVLNYMYNPYKKLPILGEVAVGSHHSPSVLAKETRFLGLLQNAEAGDFLRKMRHLTGEAGLMAQKAGHQPTDDVYKLPITNNIVKRMSAVSNPQATVTPVVDNSLVAKGLAYVPRVIKIRHTREPVPNVPAPVLDFTLAKLRGFFGRLKSRFGS